MQKTTAERQHGSKANQALWQGIRAARRQGDVPDSQRIATFGRGDNAFDTVAENRLTYGKAGPKEWDFDCTEGGCKAPVSKVERQDKRESGKHIFAFTPKVEQPCYPAAKVSSEVVAVSQGSRDVKRFRVDTIDRVTGEDTSMLVTLVTNEIHILCYGKHVIFSKTNRAKGTFKDSRDVQMNIRRPLSFAKSELVRMLGVTEGNAKYTELVALPPKRPACSNEHMDTTQPSAPDSDARSQGSTVISVRQNADGSVTGIERSSVDCGECAYGFCEEHGKVAASQS